MNKETPKLLEQHFDTAFDTPDGIKKLRELILTLAMQGKLVPQDPNDQPAGELLKEIAAEKARLIKAGKLKLSSKNSTGLKIKALDNLPSGWEFISLTDLGFFVGGKTPSTNKPAFWNGEIPWVSAKDMKSDSIMDSEDHITEAGLNSGLALIPAQSILMVVRSGILRRTFPVAINKVPCTINQDLKALVPFAKGYATYVAMMLKGFESFILSKLAKKGMTVESIVIDEFTSALFPFPPLVEQKRIVARIEQLMGRCDELERLRAERDRMSLDTHAAAINQLLSAADSENFSSAWRFITSYFAELYSVKENVAELRKTILQLAVMGKLVPQDPNDQPASELLKEIAAEKARLIKAGKLKPQKPLPPITEIEFNLNIPFGWVVCRFGDIFSLEYGDNLPSEKRSNSGEYPVYGSNGVVGSHSVPSVTSQCIVVGRKGSAGALNLSKTDGCWVTDVAYFCIPPDALDLEFSFKLFHTLGLENLGKGIKPGLNRNEAYLIPILIPPLNEQKQIVTRVDQLMALCDELEQNINAAANSRTNLLNAMMAKI
ncbi:MAG TPA: restriction endonuclease subunit S [Candidatus Ozemobacteraceae bacterium]|nr:restriction endonuclease subunit S [Candidatus Ozemobacteraceae bacterium]